MSDVTFDGKVAIITGAGGGLGRSPRADCSPSGAARVVVNDLGGSVDGTGARQTAAAAGRRGDQGRRRRGRRQLRLVATPEGGAAIVQTALDAFGTVDIVINNAGILRDKSFKNMTPEQLDAVIDVHLQGAFYVTQPAWAVMREQGYGRIVNTASAAGIFGNFGQTNYGAAKMGLVGLTRVLAVEGAKNNIKANAIAPVAKTRMTEDLLGPLADELAPEQVTPLVAYLASEDCDHHARGLQRRRRPHRAGVRRPRARLVRRQGRRVHARGRRRPPRRRSATPTASPCPATSPKRRWRS